MDFWTNNQLVQEFWNVGIFLDHEADIVDLKPHKVYTALSELDDVVVDSVYPGKMLFYPNSQFTHYAEPR